MNIYTYIQNMSIYLRILFFVKLLFDTRKLIIIIRKQKINKKIIFALFLLQKIKFEEIRKNCSYIIIYHYI